MQKIINILIMILLIIIISPTILGDNYSFGDTFGPVLNNVTYFIPTTNMTAGNVSVGLLCVNITGGDFAYDHCTIYNNETNLTLCSFDFDCPINYECSTIQVCTETIIIPTGYTPDYYAGDIGISFINMIVKIFITIGIFIFFIVCYFILKLYKKFK